MTDQQAQTTSQYLNALAIALSPVIVFLAAFFATVAIGG